MLSPKQNEPSLRLYENSRAPAPPPPPGSRPWSVSEKIHQSVKHQLKNMILQAYNGQN